MGKIKNFFKKYEKVINIILDIILTIFIFLAGVIIGKDYAERNYIASAEEVDALAIDIQDERNAVQPPSVLFEATYENGVHIPYYLILPSMGNTTDYVGQWSLQEDIQGEYFGSLNVTAIDGLFGHISFEYYGGNIAFQPTYKFTFSNIYTHFTDQFEWGYIEVLNPQQNVTYEFEIYDYMSKETDYITYNMVYLEPTNHISIDPTGILNSWWFNTEGAYNPFRYYIGVTETSDAVAFIRSYSISFTSPQPDEYFDIYYTGNINADITGYMNSMQKYGESKVPDVELSGFYVLNSIVDSVDSFMSIEILPNFSFYDILYICIGIPLTIWLLKLWLGG